MAMLGEAALAMWWDMAPAMLAEFEHWHTHEHYAERLAIPGFRRASRWRDAAGGGSVLASHGGVTARHALTVRLSPQAGSDGDGLLRRLQPLLAELPGRAGLGGAHLLRHAAPPVALTTEQKIRGGDAFADWVLVVTGYDAAVLAALVQAELADAALQGLGAAPGGAHGLYQLSYSAVPADLA